MSLLVVKGSYAFMLLGQEKIPSLGYVEKASACFLQFYTPASPVKETGLI